MRQALSFIPGKTVDVINPHATSTLLGDKVEAHSIRRVFPSKCPPISATKSLTGHSLGATGVLEFIYCLLQIKHRFICKSAHIDNLDPDFADMPIVLERIDDVDLNIAMSNSFGFGGTNVTLVLSRYSN